MLQNNFVTATKLGFWVSLPHLRTYLFLLTSMEEDCGNKYFISFRILVSYFGIFFFVRIKKLKIIH